MPDFKPGDLVRLKHPERWRHTAEKDGYLWVIYGYSAGKTGLVWATSVATGTAHHFDERHFEGADDE